MVVFKVIVPGEPEFNELNKHLIDLLHENGYTLLGWEPDILDEELMQDRPDVSTCSEMHFTKEQYQSLVHANVSPL